MATRKSPREYNATDLVKRWKSIVNDNVNIGRDAALLKEALTKYSPVQLLLGMHQCNSITTITIPQYLKMLNDWVELDETWAEIYLALYISDFVPNEYYQWLDYKEEETAHAYQIVKNATIHLQEWSNNVLS
jgi:hypothetical protein